VVTVATTVVNESTGTRCADALLELRDGEGLVVATEHGRVTVLAGECVIVRQRTYVKHPYSRSSRERHAYQTAWGVRAQRQWVLGAAAFDRAEERRVRLLKGAGFNALRSARNPMSRAMLDACDRLGMLVMDETFDAWAVPKTEDRLLGALPGLVGAGRRRRRGKGLQPPERCLPLHRERDPGSWRTAWRALGAAPRRAHSVAGPPASSPTPSTA
jgi:Glycosyl hydrolases family 2, TIM barrel domain